MMQKISRTIFVILLAASLLHAQSDNENLIFLSLEQLGQIEVITVSKEPEEIRETPAAIFVITADDIRRSGATSLAEILRLAPGIEVARIDSNHWAVGVRGFGNQFSKSVLVLIDGRSAYTPLFAGVFWDIQDTLIEDISRIEVIRGPGGTIWGANAVNGVINIITKHSRDTHGAYALLGGGNLDHLIASARYGGGNGTSFDYRFYGKVFERSAQYHYPGNRRVDDWRMGRLGFRMDWTTQGSDTFSVHGDAYKGDIGESVNIGSFFPPSQISLEGNDEVTGGNVVMRWDRSFAGGSGIQLQAYYDRTNRLAPHFKELRNSVDIDFVHHLASGRQDLIWGVGARWNPSETRQTVPTLDFIPREKTETIYSAFLQHSIDIVTDILSFTAGTKLERNSDTGFEVQPSARVMWTPTARHSFWGAVTRAIRTPSRVDSDINLQSYVQSAPLVYLEVRGNPDLNAERLIGSELGYRNLVFPSLYVDFAAFYNDYDDLTSYGAGVVSVRQTPRPHAVFSVPTVNGVEARTYGFEIAPSWQPVSRWDLKGSYSYLNLRSKSKPGFTDAGTVNRYNGSSPHHQVIVRSAITLPGNLELDQTYRYTSALANQRVGAYHTGDLRLGWRLRENVEFSVAGHNLLQPHHAEFGRENRPIVEVKRSVFAKVTITQ